MNPFANRSNIYCVLLWLLSIAQLRGQTYTVDVPFEFKTKPGTQEWRELDLEGRVAACEMPVHLAKQMTTSALVATCLNHPFVGYEGAYNDPDKAIDSFIMNNFYGYKELLMRGDAGPPLVTTYRQILDRMIATDKYEYIKWSFVNRWLANKRMLKLFTPKDRDALATVCLRAYWELSRRPKWTLYPEAVASLAVRLIVEEGAQVQCNGKILASSDLSREEATALLERKSVSPGLLKTLGEWGAAVAAH